MVKAAVDELPIHDRVYLDIRYMPRGEDRERTERIVLKLYAKDVPKTCRNFCAFIDGFDANGKTYSYKGSTFHRIIERFMIQGGDIVRGNGTGRISIYGNMFADEDFSRKHKVGVISMANSGANTNGCQFFITVEKTDWLNGKHVVFGEVADEGSMAVATRISQVETKDSSTNRPIHNVTIVGCGAVE